MLTIASNSSSANGSWRTSAFTAVTERSTPASRKTPSSSSTLTHRSHGRNCHPTLASEEDGGCAAAAAEIENPTSRLERERRENVFKLPERMRSHLERNDPPRVVPRRQWIAIGPDQRTDCRHRPSLRPAFGRGTCANGHPDD